MRWPHSSQLMTITSRYLQELYKVILIHATLSATRMAVVCTQLHSSQLKITRYINPDFLRAESSGHGKSAGTVDLECTEQLIKVHNHWIKLAPVPWPYDDQRYFGVGRNSWGKHMNTMGFG